MRKNTLRIFLLTLLLALLASCASSAKSSDTAAKTVETYLQALASNNRDELINQSCADWESQANMELDSFGAVTAKLDGVTCQVTGTDGDTTLVSCQGAIVASYNGEDQRLDLQGRTYKVIQESGEWRMCGYQ